VNERKSKASSDRIDGQPLKLPISLPIDGKRDGTDLLSTVVIMDYDYLQLNHKRVTMRRKIAKKTVKVLEG
jgi:hypothetical protein